MIRSLLAATAFTLFLAPALADDAKPPRVISLTGHGEVRLAPDMATVTVGVLSQAETAAAALAANSAAMGAVFAALKAAGIAEKDLQTSQFNVQPRYDYSNAGQPPRFIGYDVSNTVGVTVRKIETLGAVLDQVVAAGSNQINGVQFQVSKPEAALDEARRLAVGDAARRAGLYAAAAQVRLGDILSISEGSSAEPPVPMRARMLRAEAMSDAAPVAQGEQVLAVEVNMAWEIK